MPNVINSPNMSLPIPVTGIDPGPDYANNVNASLLTLDGHNHNSGSGVQITPNGLNINIDLPVNNNNLTLARSLRFSSQSSPLSQISDIGCLYEASADLYFNDGVGNQIRITQNGAVAGSPGSIANLTSPASASYSVSSSSFVWQSGANIAAAMDNGPITLRNLTLNSTGITISPPSSLPSDYTITLPSALPGTASLLSISSSGNISTTMTSALADSVGVAVTSTGANPVANARTRAIGTTVGAGGVAFSGSSGSFATTGGGPVNVTNMLVTITTTGRPVCIAINGDQSGSGGTFSMSGGAGIRTIVKIFNDALYAVISDLQTDSTIDFYSIPSSSFNAIDNTVNGIPGTYTYKVSLDLLSGTAAGIANSVLIAYEL